MSGIYAVDAEYIKPDKSQFQLNERKINENMRQKYYSNRILHS